MQKTYNQAGTLGSHFVQSSPFHKSQTQEKNESIFRRIYSDSMIKRYEQIMQEIKGATFCLEVMNFALKSYNDKMGKPVNTYNPDQLDLDACRWRWGER